MSLDNRTKESIEARYVFSHYGHLMTERERRAFRHLGGTIKATHGRSDEDAQHEARNFPNHLRKLLSDDPEVLALARGGFNSFVVNTGQRILNEHRKLIFLNYCSQCGGLARTPKARQCRFCGNDWHE